MDQDLAHRMKSIRQTVQISSAQKLVAAAQIGKARRLLHESDSYHKNVNRVIADILWHCPDIANTNKYLEPGRNGGARRGVLVLSANKGLAGGFNSNVVHFTEESVIEKPVTYMIALGQARAQFIKEGLPVDQDYFQPLDPPSMYTARELAEKILGMLENGQIDSFDVIYTEYISTVRLEVAERRLFPTSPLVFTEGFNQEAGKGYNKGHYSYEPSAQDVLHFAFIKFLKGYLYGCLIHTWLCELTARVTAMDNAVRNGNEMLDQLSLIYNRARQAAITQEITEIVAGAAAMRTEE